MFLCAVSPVLLARAFAFGGVIPTRQSAERRASIIGSIAASEYYLLEDEVKPSAQHMVIFRAPSRHTYGFIDGNNYDLPEIELRTLLCSILESEYDNDIQFLPSHEHTTELMNARQGIQCQTLTSHNQSNKKGNIIPSNINLLQWMLCSVEISIDDLAHAASRAVLTHAAFSIQETLNITEEDWKNATTNSCYIGTRQPYLKLLHQMDVIDMTNPNMSRDDRRQLLETIVSIIEQQHELKYRLNQLYSTHVSLKSTHDMMYQQPVLIYHSFLAAVPDQNELAFPNGHHLHHHHHIHFGYRTAIGLAGTSGAPSQTLRRPQRGILKEYALKNRQFTNLDSALLTSTAMEPEIGFIMANLALVGNDGDGAKVGSRILDPCCGSGRLLLYAAALGAMGLTGVDSGSIVWKDAIDEFRSHRAVGSSGASSALPVPIFCRGDVHVPTLTDAFCIPNSVDAIICDPPYNIGAPVFVDGKDMRPRNHHHDKDVESNPQMGVIESVDIISSILAIAKNVLVDGGRIVFFLPVRGDDMKLPLEELLSTRGWLGCGNDSTEESRCCLQLLKHSSRKQMFSRTFCRWLVVMKKNVNGIRC